MATIYSGTNDGFIECWHASDMLAALNGNGPSTNTAGYIFQGTFKTPACYADLGYLDFDTTSIQSVTNVTLSLYAGVDSMGTTQVIEARLLDWGATLENADWVNYGNLGALPLLATLQKTAGVSLSGTGYNAFTSDASFPSRVVTGGHTRIILCTSLMRAGSAPTNNEVMSWQSANHANPPKLDWTGPVWSSSIEINDGAEFTSQRVVHLDIASTITPPGSAPDQMCFSRDNATWGPWLPYATTSSYQLSDGDGTKTVYVKFRKLA